MFFMKTVKIVLVFLIITLLLIIQIYNYKSRINIEKSMAERKKQDSLYDKQYKKIAKDNRNLKHIRHDISKQKEVTDAIERITDFSGNVIEDTIDIIINEKKRKAQSLNIAFETDTEAFCFDMTEVDVVGLLSNLFDNAIEACERTGKKDCKVSIVVKNRYVCIINDKLSSEKPMETHFSTSKSDAKLHGLGTEIIDMIVKKYNGSMSVSDMDNKFKCEIVF